MTLDHEKIYERLEKLEEYTRNLEGYQSRTIEQLKTDKTLSGAVERYFQLATECIIDIGEILISNLGLRKPERSKDVILILSEKGIIPSDFGKRFADVASFRNILVHAYLDIDLNKVYYHLQNDLKDFSEFAKYISQYLMK